MGEDGGRGWVRLSRGRRGHLAGRIRSCGTVSIGRSVCCTATALIRVCKEGQLCRLFCARTPFPVPHVDQPIPLHAHIADPSCDTAPPTPVLAAAMAPPFRLSLPRAGPWRDSESAGPAFRRTGGEKDEGGSGFTGALASPRGRVRGRTRVVADAVQPPAGGCQAAVGRRRAGRPVWAQGPPAQHG